MTIKRQPGFYWVRGLDWEVAHWDGYAWQIVGNEGLFRPSEIDERRIARDDD